jgi:O-antigen/teichoic acid export membrane protein
MFGRGMIYAGIFALQAGAAIVITPLAVRHLSKEEFGRFVTVFTLSQLLITVLGFGLGTAIQRLYSDDSGEFRTTRGLLGFGIVLSLLTTGLVDISGPLWSQILKLGSYGMTLRFGVWAAGLAAIAMLMAQFFRSQDRLWSFAGAMLPLAVGSQLLGLLFIIFVHATATGYLEGICVGEFISVLVGFLLSRPRMWFHDRRVIVAAMSMALPLVPNGIAYQTLNLGDRIVVQHDLGAFAVGRYQLAYNAAALIMLVLMLLSQAWLPKLFAISDLEIRAAVLAESRDQLYRLLIPLILGVSLVAPLALRILAPPTYHTDRLLVVVTLVAISAIPFSTFVANSRVMIVFGLTRPLMWITPLAAAVNVALNIALVPVWGIGASALATLIGYAVLAWISGYSCRKVATVANTRASLWIALAIASAASLATALLPTTSIFLLVRLLTSVGCAAWAASCVVNLIGWNRRAP